jgi:two-component SAPR family response regulator
MSNSLYDIPLNVLVVENDRNGCRFLTEVLTRFGCNVVAACDPEEAKKLSAECSPIDLLLTDLVLPGINGVRLSKHVREQHPGIKVIFISGFTEFAARQFGFDLDGPLLEKPICAASLRALVIEVMDHARVVA